MMNAPIVPPVGTVARRSRTLTRDDIARFTEITGDFNPLHYDESLASASRFGGIIVQGGVTSGLLNTSSPRTSRVRARSSSRSTGRSGRLAR